MTHSTNRRAGDSAPLVRLGQGDYLHEIHPRDLCHTVGAADKPLDLQFLVREPADVYHAKAKGNLSSHALADFRRCPLLFHKKEQGLVVRRDSAAFQLGRAAHTLILEGRERYDLEYAVGGPINPKTGKTFGSSTKAFAQWAESIGRPALTDNEAALIELMFGSVREHLYARELLREGVAEGVVRCDYAGHACQGRFDWINPLPDRGLVDLKTCDSLDNFERDFWVFEYAHQLAFYRALIQSKVGFALVGFDPLPAGKHLCVITNATTLAVIARAYYSVDHQKLRDFARMLGSGIVTDAGATSVILLRQYLSDHYGGSQRERRVWYAKTERALMAILKGEKLGNLIAVSREQFLLPQVA